MTVEDFLEELHQLPHSAATAPLSFIVRLLDGREKLWPFALGVTHVRYDNGVAVIELEINPDAWVPSGNGSQAPVVIVQRRDIQRAKRQVEQAQRAGKVGRPKRKPA